MSKADNKELEEAIKDLEAIKETMKCRAYYEYIGDGSKDIISIETVLNEVKRLQEENKKKETEIAEHVYWESTPLNEIKKSYIPKDKIREKIEELNKNKDMISGGYAISILEELLEGK